MPGKSHERRSLVAAVHGVAWSWTRLHFHFHFSLSCIEEGNGNPLQCSCLENPRDGGAWWAAVCGVTQSRTRLKRLRSSSSSRQRLYLPAHLVGHLDQVSRIHGTEWHCSLTPSGRTISGRQGCWGLKARSLKCPVHVTSLLTHSVT